MRGPTPGHDVPRIALLRALQLGDLLCAVPALRALRAAHPSARIALIGLPWARELLPRYPALLDELIEFPGFPGMPEREVEPGRVTAFFEEMRGRRFDLTVQLHGDGTLSNVFVAMLGGRASIGAFRPGRWCPGSGYVPYPEHLPEVQRALAVVAPGGTPTTDAIPRFPLLPADQVEIHAAVPGHSAAPYACIHPGARDPRRRWPPERFAAAADELAEGGLRILLTGTREDEGVHAAVLAAMRAPAASLAGRLSLGGFAALLAGARLVVTNDTGASHLASAVAAPTVTVFVASDPGRWAPPPRENLRNVGGPWAPPLACCAGEACATPQPVWRDVAVEEVLSAARQVGERGSHRRAA